MGEAKKEKKALIKNKPFVCFGVLHFHMSEGSRWFLHDWTNDQSINLEQINISIIFLITVIAKGLDTIEMPQVKSTPVSFLNNTSPLHWHACIHNKGPGIKCGNLKSFVFFCFVHVFWRICIKMKVDLLQAQKNVSFQQVCFYFIFNYCFFLAH